MTSRIDIRGTLISCLARTVDLPETSIGIDDLLEDIGIDSLNFLRLMTMIEEDIGLQIPPEIEHTLKTPADILKYIEDNLLLAVR